MNDITADPFAHIVQHLMLVTSGASYSFVPSEALLALPYLQHLRNWDEHSGSFGNKHPETLVPKRGTIVDSRLDVMRFDGRTMQHLDQADIDAAVQDFRERVRNGARAHGLTKVVAFDHDIRIHILSAALRNSQSDPQT